MALIKCEECGHMISDKASECPNCGAPMERKSNASVVEENGNKVKERGKTKSAQLKYIIGAGILVILAILGYFIYTQMLEDKFNGHEYVDLGLSVKWATCNVGANTPEEYGDYFAWGEIEPKAEYTEGNCTTYDKDIGDIAGNPNYDAARANWGGTWRMPTRKEIEELIYFCTTESTTRNGVNGILVTSKKNGNSIFLPNAGWRDESGLRFAGERGVYWSSSTKGKSDTKGALDLGSGRADLGNGWSFRYDGMSVRPVSDGTTMPKGAKTISSRELSTPSGTANGYDYVDLGLSVKWATCNVGASSPEDYGDYYAWGETRTKSTYTENNCTTWDKKLRNIAGNPNYDAARANWGGTWRMPTEDEIEELKHNCTTECTTHNGVKGVLVTSWINGNSIFLPAAGLRNESLIRAGEDGAYWSSSSDDNTWAGFLSFESEVSDFGYGTWHRDGGYSVRPVSE